MGYRGARLVRGIGVATAGLAALAAALLPIDPSAAEAATGAPIVLVSSDGVNFSESLRRGLFEGAGALVPGDRVSATLWVRNPAPMGAALRVSVRGASTTSASFAEGTALSTWDSATNRASSRTFAELDSCEILMTAQDIPPGGVVRMELTIAMDDFDGSTAQAASGNFDLMVAMRDAQGGPLSSTACDDEGVIVSSSGSTTAPPRSTLAFTGGGLPVGGITAGSLLVGAGMAVFAARRRRAADDER